MTILRRRGDSNCSGNVAGGGGGSVLLGRSTKPPKSENDENASQPTLPLGCGLKELEKQQQSGMDEAKAPSAKLDCMVKQGRERWADIEADEEADKDFYEGVGGDVEGQEVADGGEVAEPGWEVVRRQAMGPRATRRPKFPSQPAPTPAPAPSTAPVSSGRAPPARVAPPRSGAASPGGGATSWTRADAEDWRGCDGGASGGNWKRGSQQRHGKAGAPAVRESRHSEGSTWREVGSEVRSNAGWGKAGGRKGGGRPGIEGQWR